METKEIDIPDGYEFAKVENGKIILTKMAPVLPESWAECFIPSSVGFIDGLEAGAESAVPKKMVKAVLAFNKLLVCRNRWWELLEWSPNWEDGEEKKFCIYMERGEVLAGIFYTMGHLLAFPTLETRDHFLKTFRTLINEAKDILQ